MHITSLPSPYGIGSMGKAAYDFIDFLKEAKQTYWQILPINPPGYGDSPYQAFSTFAGNPYLIDLDALVKDGYLLQEELDRIDWGSRADQVDFPKCTTSAYGCCIWHGADSTRPRPKTMRNMSVSRARGWMNMYSLWPSRHIITTAVDRVAARYPDAPVRGDGALSGVAARRT